MKQYTLTPGDIAKLVNKSPQWVTREILRGRLIGVKIGRSFRINEQDWEDYLARCVTATPQPPWYSGASQDAIDDQHLEEAEPDYDPDADAIVDPSLEDAGAISIESVM